MPTHQFSAWIGPCLLTCETLSGAPRTADTALSAMLLTVERTLPATLVAVSTVA